VRWPVYDFTIAGYHVCGVWLQPPRAGGVLVSDTIGIQALPVFQDDKPWRWIIASGGSVVSKSFGGFVRILPGITPDLWSIDDTSFATLDAAIEWWRGPGGDRERLRMDRARTEAQFRSRERLQHFWQWPGALN
jgi:hypothetical protein